MKILICGEYGVFCKELISRLKKERHTVFVITGSEKPRFHKPADGVFQEYNFSYRSKSINTVMKNVQADVLIITGACDIKYTWQDKNHDSVRYLSGVTNLLMCARDAGIRQVIYCSSMGVYEDSLEEVITKESPLKADSDVLQTYVQIEHLCDKQHEGERFRITRIRFPEVYGDYRAYEYDICSRLLHDFWHSREVLLAPEKQHRVMYVRDAVDVLMRVFADENRDAVYLVPGETFTEQQITDEIKSVVPNLTAEIKSTETQRPSIPLVEENSLEALGFREKYTLKAGLSEFYRAYGKAQNMEDGKESRMAVLRRKLFPLLENVGLFAAATAVAFLLRDTWAGEHINFYLFYMVIISVVYGCGHALIASLFVFFIRAAQMLSGTAGIEYTAFIDALQILVVGVSVGYMRDKYKRKNDDLEDEKKYFQSELVDMTKIYDGSRYLKEVYEKRLMSYENSMARIYEIASRLDSWEPQKVIFEAVDVAKELLDIEAVAIYMAGKNAQYLRLMASSTPLSRTLGKSICADEQFFMHDALAERAVYRNREIDSQLPSYACGVFTEGSLTGIVMLWTKELTKINLYQSNMLALLCHLIEASMSRAKVYWNELSGQYIEGTGILQEAGFQKMLELCKQGRRENKVLYTLLHVPKEALDKDRTAVYEKAGRLVRETDYIGQTPDGLRIILMNANEQESDYVLQRFHKAGIPVEIISD